MILFKKKKNILSVLMIGVAVILLWRGTWGLADLFLFPDDQVLSYAFSVVIGLGILILTRKIVDTFN